MRLILLIVTFIIAIGLIAIACQRKKRPVSQQNSTDDVSKTEVAATAPGVAKTATASGNSPSPAPANSAETSVAEIPDTGTPTPSKPAPKAEIVRVTPVTVDVSKLPPSAPESPTLPQKSHPLMPGPGPKPVDAPVPPPQR
jgi:hypothetical protein